MHTQNFVRNQTKNQASTKSIRKNGRGRGGVGSNTCLACTHSTHAYTDADLGALETGLEAEWDAMAPEVAPPLPAKTKKYTATRTTGMPTPSPTPRPMAKLEEAGDAEEGLGEGVPVVVPPVVVPPLVEDAAPQFPAQGLHVESVASTWL